MSAHPDAYDVKQVAIDLLIAELNMVKKERDHLYFENKQLKKQISELKGGK